MKARLPYLVALVAGALLACGFAPLNWWPLALLCPAVLMYQWQGSTPRRAAWLGFWFGSGTFSLGTYWLYISIHGPAGGAPIWLTLFIMGALVAIMAAYHALMGFLAVRFLPASGPWRHLLGVPALWLLIEWLRGWFLSGFPWLSLGYSQTDTWLAGFAPVGGVYFISALLLLGSGALVSLLRDRGRTRLLALALLVLPWPLGKALMPLQWGTVGGPVTVAVLQGAVPQEIKWKESSVAPTQKLYTDLEHQALGARLIVWPEAALPELADYIPDYLGQQWSLAQHEGSDILMGILRVDVGEQVYNSIMSMAETPHPAFYNKHHLVPFAEYFPVPNFIRNWLKLMDLPYSDLEAGETVQSNFVAGGAVLAPSICYEDAYGSSNLPGLRAGANLLVNVTNDAWFGHSWARYQHFQISRMRAMEARRPLLRAANDGVSALVGSHGEVLAEAEEFKPTVLRGTVHPQSGLTPYVRFGNALPVVLGLLGVALAFVRQIRKY